MTKPETSKSIGAAEKLAIALDYSNIPDALDLYDSMYGRAGLFKVGKELKEMVDLPTPPRSVDTAYER